MPLRREILTGGLALTLAGGRAFAVPLGRDIAAVNAFVASDKFQGVVMVGTAGRATYARAFGMADIEAATPMRVENVFGIASISKWFTATAVLKLCEAGKLDLDAPITRWLPDYRADTGAKLTLRYLLANNSGVPNAPFNDAVKLDPALLTTPVPTVEAVRRFGQGDLSFEPGARFDYAFTNYILILAIIEAVTGQPYPQAMQALVFKPLGLTAIRGDDAYAAAPITTASYRTVDPLVRRPNSRLPMMLATGGYYSDAADLLKAAHQIFDTGFLSAASRKALTTIEVETDHYALGGRVRTLTVGGRQATAAWETGNAAGYRSVLGHRLDNRRTVVILNNTSLSQKRLDEFADAIFAEVA